MHLEEHHQNLYDQGLRIISLGRTWNQPYSCSEWADLGASYPLIDDQVTQLWADFGTGVVPNNVIIDTDGTVRYSAIGLNETQILSVLTEILTPDTVDEEAVIPERIELQPNYPNPFNGSTWIPFSLQHAEQLTLTIYTLDGRLVTELYKGVKTAGEYEISWDGRDQAGRAVASGLYLVSLRSSTSRASSKLLLNK